MADWKRVGTLAVAIGIAAAVGVLATIPSAEAALVICKRKKKVTLREDACKSKETRVDAAELGVVGPTGSAGAPGDLRIYGNGSAGALTIDDFQHLQDVVADGNLQFTTVTINSGGTLVVPSGTVIRCSESFTNNGSIMVDNGASPGELSVISPTVQVIPRSQAAHPGFTSTHARGPGATQSATGWEAGGATGLSDRARWMLQPGPNGGGGGFSGPWGGGASGGGALTVLARQGITNTGSIQAEGQDAGSNGASGGGGGFVILASATAIFHAAPATISVHGGGGAAAGDSAVVGVLPEYTAGPGGGGGGGCVHLLAPAVTNAGAVDVAGGAAGLSQTVTLRTLRVGGAGGGASCGSGGGGGRISGSTTPGAAEAGTTGRLFVTVADPTAMF